MGVSPIGGNEWSGTSEAGPVADARGWPIIPDPERCDSENPMTRRPCLRGHRRGRDPMSSPRVRPRVHPKHAPVRFARYAPSPTGGAPANTLAPPIRPTTEKSPKMPDPTNNPETPHPPNCTHCESCGQLANDNERTPWIFWANCRPRGWRATTSS